MKATISYSSDGFERQTEIKTIEDLVKAIGVLRSCRIDIVSKEEMEIYVYNDLDDYT